MNTLQYSIIGVLAVAAAISVLFFDKRGKTHKPLSSLIAYITFVQMAALAGAAYMQAQQLVVWLLIIGLAVYVGGILLARGNITKVFVVQGKSHESN